MVNNVQRNITERNKRFKELEELKSRVRNYHFESEFGKKKIDDYVKAIYEEVDYTKDPSEAGWPPKLKSEDLIKHFIHQTQK